MKFDNQKIKILKQRNRNIEIKISNTIQLKKEDILPQKDIYRDKGHFNISKNANAILKQNECRNTHCEDGQKKLHFVLNLNVNILKTGFVLSVFTQLKIKSNATVPFRLEIGVALFSYVCLSTNSSSLSSKYVTFGILANLFE